MRNRKNRRMISFEEDIIEDVFNRLDGKYSRKQLMHLFRASLNYAVSILKYTDAVTVSIPSIGDLHCNLGQMNSRLLDLQRIRKEKNYALPPDLKCEYEAIKEKISYLESEKSKREKKTRDLRFINIRQARYKLKRNMPLELLEDFQDKEFK